MPTRANLLGLLCFALARLLAPLPCAAQVSPSINLVPLHIQGFPDCDITSLVKDHDGFLWIGTNEGLMRYDGINLDVYREVPGDSTSLPSDVVFSLECAEDGRIWASTGSGICRFDPQVMKFEAIPYVVDGAKQFPESRIHFAHQGNIWANYLGRGVARYDPLTRTFIDVPAVERETHTSGGHLRCNAMVSDEEGILWITNTRSITRYDPRTDSARSYPFTPVGTANAPSTLLMGPCSDPEDPNILWIRSWGAGIVRFDKRTGQFEQWMNTFGMLPNISNIVWSMAPLGHGQWLVGFDGELLIFDASTKLFSEPIRCNKGRSEPIHQAVFEQYADAVGQRWLGTGHDGIYTIPKAPLGLELLAPAHTLADAEGGGYWGTSIYGNRRLFRWDDTGRSLYELPLPEADRLQYEAFHLLQRRNGEVWLSTTAGLLVFDPHTRQFNWKFMTGLQEKDGRMRLGGSLVEQPDGTVWTIGWGKGVIRYDPVTDQFSTPQPPPNTSDDRIAAREVGLWDDHHIWALFGNGCGVLDTRTMRMAEIMTTGHPGPGAQGILTIVPYGPDRADVVTAHNGVYTMAYDGEQLTPIAHHDDAGSLDKFEDAVADDQGYTWIASSGGLVRFDPSTGVFDHFGPTTGFPMNMASGILKDARGRLIAFNDRLVRFEPKNITFSVGKVPVYVRNVIVNGIAHNEPLLTLPHDSSSVSIEFAPIDLTNASKLQYEVQLQGHDATWVDNEQRRAASYINLSPGQYTFFARVKGAAVGSKVARVHFTVRPAWYQEWWFRIAAVLASALLIFLLSRHILRLHYERRIAALEQEQAVGAVRSRIARDIHDDIGSGLTKITMLSRELSKSASKEADQDRLAGNIASASTDLIQQLSEIVWTNDPGNDLAPRFVAYLRNMLGKQFEELSVELRADLHVEPAAETLLLGPEMKRNVVLFLKEAVSNALKYADAKSIAVRVVIGAAGLELNVQDDGHGFDPVAKAAAGHGLQNMRKRAASMGGAYTFNSNEKGTALSLRVPFTPSTNM